MHVAPSVLCPGVSHGLVRRTGVDSESGNRDRDALLVGGAIDIAMAVLSNASGAGGVVGTGHIRAKAPAARPAAAVFRAITGKGPPIAWPIACGFRFLAIRRARITVKSNAADLIRGAFCGNASALRIAADNAKAIWILAALGKIGRWLWGSVHHSLGTRIDGTYAVLVVLVWVGWV